MFLHSWFYASSSYQSTRPSGHRFDRTQPLLLTHGRSWRRAVVRGQSKSSCFSNSSRAQWDLSTRGASRRINASRSSPHSRSPILCRCSFSLGIGFITSDRVARSADGGRINAFARCTRAHARRTIVIARRSCAQWGLSPRGRIRAGGWLCLQWDLSTRGGYANTKDTPNAPTRKASCAYTSFVCRQSVFGWSRG